MGPEFGEKWTCKGFRRSLPGGIEMSLIIDALKKAQQLRLKGAEGTPISKGLQPDKKRKTKKEWILIGAGLLGSFFILFVLLKPAFPPLATQTDGAASIPEKKPFVRMAEKISSEPSKEMLNLSRDEDPLHTAQAEDVTRSGRSATQGHSKTGMAFSDRSSPPIGKKVSPTIKSSFNEKRRLSPVKEGPKEEETIPLKKTVTEKSLPPLPLANRREEVSSKSFGVEQEGGQDSALTLDVLNHFNSGVLFFNRREFSKAIQAYQKAIELDPTYVEAYNNLGITYQMIGESDKAFEVYERATKINPKYEKGYNNLGTLLLLKDRYEEALDAFQKALGINSNNIESHVNLGILFKNKGQLEKAIESYQTALTIDPFHKETHYNIALLYEQMENLELAIGHYQQFIQLSLKSRPELVSKVQRHLNDLIETNRNKRQ
jgi:Tfp pilus assembly protein PilF